MVLLPCRHMHWKEQKKEELKSMISIQCYAPLPQLSVSFIINIKIILDQLLLSGLNYIDNITISSLVKRKAFQEHQSSPFWQCISPPLSFLPKTEGIWNRSRRECPNNKTKGASWHLNFFLMCILACNTCWKCYTEVRKSYT